MRGSVALLVAFSLICAARPSCAANGACTDSVGLPLSAANRKEVVFFGRAWGQVFAAPDTLLAGVTVWRSAQDTLNASVVQLWVTKVDSTGKPIPWEVLYEGPWMQFLHGYGVPLAMEFNIDPPLSLPGRGHYWFAVKDANCNGTFAIYADSTGSYVDGDAWRTTPGGLCEGAGGGAQRYDPGVDLVFRVDFCNTTTAVHKESWGHVKTLYR
jgi:hypothetical protein